MLNLSMHLSKQARIIVKMGLKKQWWFKGIVFIGISLLCLLYLMFFAIKVECFLEGGSSPCGILSVPLFGLLVVLFLILGIIFLIRDKIKSRK